MLDYELLMAKLKVHESKYKKGCVMSIRIVKSNVSSIGWPSSERIRVPVSFWRRANARNVRLYYPYRQYTNLFIFQFVSLLCLRTAAHYTLNGVWYEWRFETLVPFLPQWQTTICQFDLLEVRSQTVKMFLMLCHSAVFSAHCFLLSTTCPFCTFN